MSSSQVFPTLSGTIDPQQICSDVAAAVVSTDWYGPSSYVYNDPYITPFPSSTVESGPWSSYARASVPDISATYAVHQHHQPQDQQIQMSHAPHFKDPSRPHSSPSTFGPSPEAMPWPATNGLGIQYTGAIAHSTPISASYPPDVFQTFPTDESYKTSTPPELRQPQPRRPYTIIAPSPIIPAPGKRRRDTDEEASEPSSSAKRRRRTTSIVSPNLHEDERFLVHLKESENLPWKEIANRFETDKGQNHQVAALQMRYKRLREKFRAWDDQDLQALRLAHEYWEKYKWEIISAKMLDFGVAERWPSRQCARKWQELEATAATTATTSAMTPTMSQFSSPIDPPMQFAFIPLHSQ